MITAQKVQQSVREPVSRKSNRSLFFSPVQPKLTINQPGDEYEQEADAVAEKVMRMKDTKASQDAFFKPAIAPIQRRSAHSEEKTKQPVQRKETITTEPSPAPETIQRQETAPAPPATDNTSQVLSEGAGIVTEQLGDQPGFEEWKKRQTEQLKLKLWDNQPTELKAGLISFGLMGAGILGSAFALDPVFRSGGVQFLNEKNLALPLQLLPYHEYYAPSSFKYKLPSAQAAPYTFETEFEFDAFFDLMRKKWNIPQVSLAAEVDSSYSQGGGFSPFTGGKIKLKLGGGMINIAGYYNQPLPPVPMLVSNPAAGEPPVWLMRSLPGQLNDNLPKGSGIFITVDIMRIPELLNPPRPAPEKTIQRKQTGNDETGGNAAPAIVHEVLSAQSGTPLDGATQGFMESRFGQDFSSVRVHTGSKAADSATAIQAKAYTSGSNIVFGRGEYQPQTDAGKSLLAHELTHVVQQQSGQLGNAVQQVPANLTPFTVTASGFQSTATALSQNIDEPGVKENARIMVAIGNQIQIYDGNAVQLTTSRPVGLLSSIHLPNGVYKSMSSSAGTPSFFYRIYDSDDGIVFTRAVRNDQQVAEDIMLSDIVRQPDRDYLNSTLGAIPHWFLVLPGGAGGSGGQRSTPGWAVQITANLLQSLVARSAATSTTTGGSSGAQTSVPPVEVPDRLVPWTDEAGVHANVWAHGAHTTVTLAQNQSIEELESHVREVTKNLRNATDASQSTTVANGAQETGFTAPTPESRQQQEGAGSGPGTATTPQQQHQQITNVNSRANLPAYTSRINNYGSDVSVTGGNNRMAMELDYSIAGSDLLSQVTSRMQSINYYWEIFDVTNVPIPIDTTNAANYTTGTGEAVGAGSGAGNELARGFHANYEDQRADVEEMANSGVATNLALWQVRAAQLNLMVLSASVRAIGNLISSYVSIVTTPLNERNIGWDREGEYVVRCVATPVYTEGSEYRRASSVAVQAIKITNINSRAELEADRDQQELADMRRRLEHLPPGPDRDLLLRQIAEKMRVQAQSPMDSVAEQVTSTRQQLDYINEIVWMREHGTPPTNMTVNARSLRALLELNGINPEEFQAHTQRQLELMENMQRYGNRMMAGMKAPVYRPRIVLASEENGQVSLMVMMLGETSDSTDARRKYRLVDMTSPNTQDAYEGESTQAGIAGHSQAIQNALYRFRDNSEYGRGTIAVRLPANMPEGITVEQSMRSRPGTSRRWMQRLADLATVAEIAGLVLTGPGAMAIGIVGGLAGAAVSVDSLMRRSHAGRFRWNFQTVMEISGVVGGVLPFGGMVRRLERTVFYVGIGQLGLSALSIPIQLNEQLRAIEMDTSLPPGEKRARSAEALLAGVKSGVVLVVSATQMAQHGIPPKHAAPSETTGTHEVPTERQATPRQLVEAIIPEIDPSVIQQIESPEGAAPARPVEGIPATHEPTPSQEPTAETPRRTTEEPAPAERRQEEEPERDSTGNVHTPAPATVQAPGATSLLRASIIAILQNAALSQHPSQRVRAAQRGSQIRRLIDANPGLRALARGTLIEAGSFKSIRDMIRQSFFGAPEANQMAQSVLQEVRMRMADEAMRTAIEYASALYPDLTPRLVDMGSPGFASDRDVTMQFRGGGEGAIAQRIDASLQAVRRAYDTLRSQGIEPDAVLDTNFYTELHEASIRPQTAHESAQILFDQSIVSMTEIRMGMDATQWAAYKAEQIRRLSGTPDATSTQGRMEGEARARLEAEFAGAETLAGQMRPQGQTPATRDALLTQKREDLSQALRRNAPAREIRQLMAEIKLLEPEAYGTRAAVESVPGRQQAWARGGPEAYMSGRKLPEGRVERLAFLAQDASANLGLLFGHSQSSGNSLSTSRSVAKYLERVAHAVMVDGRLPVGDMRRFLNNLRQIIETKSMSPAANADAAALLELRTALAAAGHSQQSLATMSDSAVVDAWVAQAREHGMSLVAQVRTAEQMAHVQEGGPSPIGGTPAPPATPPAPAGGPVERTRSTSSEPAIGRITTPPVAGDPPAATLSNRVYVTDSVPGQPTSGTIHVVRNGEEATFARTNRTLMQNIGRGYLHEIAEGTIHLSVDEMRGKRVLDIAAGTEGFTVQQLRAMGIEAYGMDIALSATPESAPGALAGAAGTVPPEQFLRAGDLASGIPFSGQFNIIYELYGGISYGLAQSHPEVVQTLLQHLAPGGILYLAPLDVRQQQVLANLIPATAFRIERVSFHGEDQIWRVTKN